MKFITLLVLLGFLFAVVRLQAEGPEGTDDDETFEEQQEDQLEENEEEAEEEVIEDAEEELSEI